MPLMWIFSVEMSFFLLSTLINLYNLKEVYNLKENVMEEEFSFISLMW